MTRILLVRHGESTWNAVGRWQGQADPELTARGRAQAAEAAGSLGMPDALITSDLVRAADTATIIGNVLGVDIVVEPGLRERDAGPLSGLDRHQIHRRFPGLLPDDPAGYAPAADGRPAWPAGFEPDDRLWARVEAVLTALGRLIPGGDVVAVTHSGVIYTVERCLGSGDRPRLENLEATCVTAESGRLVLGDRLPLIASATGLTPEE